MLQTILSVAVVQLDIYSDKLLSFPSSPFAHIFAIKKQDMSDFSFIPSTSVVTIPGAHASAAFTSKTSEVFKEENDIAPIIINDKMKYIPWGGDNQMPYNIIDLIESDETMYKHKWMTLCRTTTSQVTVKLHTLVPQLKVS